MASNHPAPAEPATSAEILRERHGGSSQVADWLDGVGNHV